MQTCLHCSIVACLSVLTLVPAQHSRASDIVLPPDTKFLFQLDLKEFGKTSIGTKLIELTAREAAREMETEGEQLLEKVNESLGFDPLQEIRTITLATSVLGNPERAFESGALVVQLGKTTGNLEGLMLALPGYDSKEHDDHTLHYVGEGSQTAVCSLFEEASGNHTLVLAREESQVLRMLESLGSVGTADSVALDDGVFARVQLFEIPLEEIREEPAANVLKLVKQASLTIRETDAKLMRVDLNIEAVKEKKAEQIRQLLTGATAAIGLFLDNVDELKDPELRKTAEDVLESLKVEREDSNVHLQFSFPTKVMKEVLREQADLEL
ncbi:MAG TPA: hypothetical protein DDW52_15340 [Planctomycetaceae bacterium]|nr:hypothetical protein [Planctomycetaceae bacterium]